MPLNGSGGYTPPAPYFPAIPGQIIYSDYFNIIILDMSEAMSEALYRDGQQVWTGDEDADGNGIVNVGDLSADAGGATFTGQWTFGTSPLAPTPTVGDNSTKLATTAFAVALAFQTALPAQTGNSAKTVVTDGSSAAWGLPGMFVLDRTSNTILAQADRGKLIRVTSGTFTQTFDTVTANWYVNYKNAGTGDITLSLTLDGVANPVMYPNEERRIHFDGSTWTSVITCPFTRTVTTTEAVKIPAGYTAIAAGVVSGGAGGSRPDAGSGNAAGGGGGGCYSGPQLVYGIAAGTSVTCTIGAGGAGASANNSQGTAGGTSSFGSYVICNGGTAGPTAPTGGTAQGSGGSAGTTQYTATTSAIGFAGASNNGGTSGPAAEFGGGCGATGSAAAGLTGGGSVWGGGGGGSGGGTAGPDVGGAGGISGNYQTGGGAAGGSAGGVTGGAGTAGTASTSRFSGGGGGGGGGGGSTTGGAGGAGGTPGGGGGGGGAGGTTTGNGGAGARGEIRLWGIV